MIELRQVSRTYETRGVRALNDVSLRIDRNELVTIMGPSGSGKTTLLQILGTLDAPDEGTYRLEDCDISGLSDREKARIRNRHFGFVFQSFYLLRYCTCLENVMLPLKYAGASLRSRRDRAREILEMVGLSHRLNHYPSMMSGGEQQRVAVARALANRPTVVFADEPTGNLPGSMSAEIMQLFLRLHETGVTFVIVTHSDEIAKYGRRRIRIEDGSVVSDVTTDAQAMSETTPRRV